MTGEPPYRITLVLDGWIWSGDDLDKTLADLRKLLESRQTPTTGASVHLRELTVADCRQAAIAAIADRERCPNMRSDGSCAIAEGSYCVCEQRGLDPARRNAAPDRSPPPPPKPTQPGYEGHGIGWRRRATDRR